MNTKLLINFFRNKENGIDTDIKDFEEYFNSICYEYHRIMGILSNDLVECKDEYAEVEIIKKLRYRAMDEVIILQNLVEFLIESNKKKDSRIDDILNNREKVYIEDII